MYQVKETTYEEKIKMYMKCKKLHLAEMLIECNKQLTHLLLNQNKTYKLQ
jgi:hypothetical protein